jgi:hypothetical protein
MAASCFGKRAVVLDVYRWKGPKSISPGLARGMGHSERIVPRSVDDLEMTSLPS